MQPVWQNVVLHVNSCSRLLYMSSLTCHYIRPHTLICHLARHLSNCHQRPTQNTVQSLPRSSNLSTTASCELARLWQHDCCSSSSLAVTHQPVVLGPSRSLSSTFHCNKAKAAENHHHVNFHQLHHYIPRQLTSSTKTIVEASPISLQPYLRLIRFDRPIGTWLLFLPCAWSISLAAPAGQLPDATMLALFALGSFSMRAAACTINDMWDKDYDARVARTRDRPLACGEISQFRALTFLALPLSVSLGILLTFNLNTIALGTFSLVPCIIYPLMKRITYWPQAFLGITLNWGVMIAWSAIHGSLTTPGFVLYTSCVLWTMLYDTIYSHQDKDDDVMIGVKSTALKFGNRTKLWLAGFATGVSGGLTITGAMCHQPWLYFAGVGVVTAHLAHQMPFLCFLHTTYLANVLVGLVGFNIHLVNLNDAVSCATTFRSTRNIGLVFWAFIVGSGLLAGGTKKDREDPAMIALT